MKRENLIVVFVLMCGLLRLIPHPPNFAPITALALFSGVMFQNRLHSLIIPLVSMVISDLFLGFYSITIWVYLGFILVTMFGWYSQSMRVGAVLSSSLLFFIVSNFGVWLIGYPHTIVGLIQCYVLAIPFFAIALLGDLFWCYIFKKMYVFIEQSFIKVW